MQTAASSRGVSRSARAMDGLPFEFNHKIGFSSQLDKGQDLRSYAEYEVRRKQLIKPLDLVWSRFSIFKSGRSYPIFRCTSQN